MAVPRFTVAPGHEFNYPSELDAKIIRAVGGRSKMSKEALAAIKFKTATEGMDCSDMPKDAFDLYLERGWIIDNQNSLPVVEATVVEETPAAAPTAESEGEK